MIRPNGHDGQAECKSESAGHLGAESSNATGSQSLSELRRAITDGRTMASVAEILVNLTKSNLTFTFWEFQT